MLQSVQGEWINIAGPISEADYELLMLNRQQKLLTFSSDVLTRCNVEVVAEKAAVLTLGDIYCASATDKLYLCTPLDDVIDGRAGRIPPARSSDDVSPRGMYSRPDINVKNAKVQKPVELRSMESSPSLGVDAPPVNAEHDTAKADEGQV
jgi:hypothetical protein